MMYMKFKIIIEALIFLSIFVLPSFAMTCQEACWQRSFSRSSESSYYVSVLGQCMREWVAPQIGDLYDVTKIGGAGEYNCEEDEYCYCYTFHITPQRDTRYDYSPGYRYYGTSSLPGSCPPDPRWQDPEAIPIEEVPGKNPNQINCDKISDFAIVASMPTLVKANSPVTISGAVTKFSETCEGLKYTYRKYHVAGCRVEVDKGFFRTKVKIKCNDCPSNWERLVCQGEESHSDWAFTEMFTIIGTIVGTMLGCPQMGLAIGMTIGTAADGIEEGDSRKFAMALAGLSATPALSKIGDWIKNVFTPEIPWAGVPLEQLPQEYQVIAAKKPIFVPGIGIVHENYTETANIAFEEPGLTEEVIHEIQESGGLEEAASGSESQQGLTEEELESIREEISSIEEQIESGSQSSTEESYDWNELYNRMQILYEKSASSYLDEKVVHGIKNCVSICKRDWETDCVYRATARGCVLDYLPCYYHCRKRNCGGYKGNVEIKLRDSNGRLVKRYTTRSNDEGIFDFTFRAPSSDGNYSAEVIVKSGNVTRNFILEFKVYEIENLMLSSEPQEFTGLPGSDKTFEITVENRNPIPVDFDVTVSAPSGWNATYPDKLRIGASSVGRFDIIVVSPGSASDGTYNIQVNVESEQQNLVGSTVLRFKISGHQKPSITAAPVSQHGIPGERKTYTLQVKNNDPETFISSRITLNITSKPNDWDVRLSRNVINVRPGETVNVTLEVTSNSTPTEGDNFIEIEATMYDLKESVKINYIATLCGDSVCQPGEALSCQSDCPPSPFICSFNGRCERQTDWGVEFSASIDPSIGMLTPTFVVCKRGSNVETCFSDYSAGACGINSDCICGNFPDLHCSVRCVDKSGAYYLAARGWDGSTIVTITSANYSYECPYVGLDELILLRDSLENSLRNYDEMLGNLDYLMRSNPEEKPTYQPCYDTVEMIINKVRKFIPYLSDVIASPAISNTTQARSLLSDMVEENSRLINSNCYGAVGLLRIESVIPPSRTEAGNVASAVVKVRNTAPIDYYGYVECAFTDPLGEITTMESDCKRINSGQLANYEFNIDVNVTGDWTMVCSVYGSLESDCSTALHDTSDVITFNVFTKDIFVQDVYGTCYPDYIECQVTTSREANCVGCKLNSQTCRKIETQNQTTIFKCPKISNSVELEGYVYQLEDCNPITPISKKTIVECPICGNDVVDSGEECEPPNSTDNQYCPQTTWTCQNGKYGARDEYGSCLSCQCSYDPFEFSCIKGMCGAECSDDSDCDDGNPDTIDICNENCQCISTEECPFECVEQCVDDSTPPECFVANSYGSVGCPGNLVCCKKTLVSCPVPEREKYISIFSPLSYSNVHGEIKIDALTDNVTSVQYAYHKLSPSCANSSWYPMSLNNLSGRYEATFDTRNIKDGNYFICVKAVFNDGESKITSVRDVTINNYDFDLWPSGSINVRSGDSAEYKVFLRNKGETDTYSISSNILPSSWSLTALVNGKQTSYVTLKNNEVAEILLHVSSPLAVNLGDTATVTVAVNGKYEEKNVDITFTISELSNSPPVLYNITLSQHTLKSGDTITFSARIEEPDGDDVFAKVCTSSSCDSSYCVLEDKYDTGIYVCNYEADLEPGEYEYYIYAEDSNGLSIISDKGEFTVYDSNATGLCDINIVEKGCDYDIQLGAYRAYVTVEWSGGRYAGAIIEGESGTKQYDKTFTSEKMVEDPQSPTEIKINVYDRDDNVICTKNTFVNCIETEIVESNIRCESSSDCKGTTDSCYCSNGICKPCGSGFVCRNNECVLKEKKSDASSVLLWVMLIIILIVIVLVIFRNRIREFIEERSQLSMKIPEVRK